MKKIFLSQKGVVPPGMLLLMIAVLGIVIYIFISSTLPFKNIFGQIQKIGKDMLKFWKGFNKGSEYRKNLKKTGEYIMGKKILIGLVILGVIFVIGVGAWIGTTGAGNIETTPVVLQSIFVDVDNDGDLDHILYSKVFINGSSPILVTPVSTLVPVVATPFQQSP